VHCCQWNKKEDFDFEGSGSHFLGTILVIDNRLSLIYQNSLRAIACFFFNKMISGKSPLITRIVYTFVVRQCGNYMVTSEQPIVAQDS